MSKPEVLLMDVGGVLIDECDITQSIRRQINLEDDVFSRIWKKYIPMYGRGEISSQRELWHEFGRDVTSDVMGQALAEKLRIRESVLQYVQMLGESGVRLAILSDTNQDHANVLQSASVYDIVPSENLFLSHELGMRKSDGNQVFGQVLGKLGISEEPCSALFVDDRQQYLNIAQESGVDTMLAGNEQETLEDLRAIFGK